MGDDAERAEDEYWRMSQAERDEADAEIDAWHADECERCGAIGGSHWCEGYPDYDELDWAPEDDFVRDAVYSDEETRPVPDSPEALARLDAVVDAFFGVPPGTAARKRKKGKKMADDGFDPPLDRRRQMDNRFYRERSAPERSSLRLFAALGSAPLLEALARAAQEAQDTTARFPVEPPEGSILRYQKTFPSSPKVYSYIALRAGGQWYRTGRHNEPITWDELVGDIANWPCHVARTWGEIPQAPAALFEGEDPDVWYREMYENTVTVDSDKQN